MDIIRKYIKSAEYIIILAISLFLSGFLAYKGFAATDIFLMVQANRFYMNFIALAIFTIYILRKSKKAQAEQRFNIWLDNSKNILLLSAFTIISISLAILIIGEIFTLLGFVNIETRQIDIVKKQNDFRSLGPVQAFTGLSFFAILAMTLSFTRSKFSKIILAILILFYFANIVFTDWINFPLFLDPIMQMSTYYALDYSQFGPYLVSLFHILAGAIIGNALLVLEKLEE